jgi:hypothetical protein
MSIGSVTGRATDENDRSAGSAPETHTPYRDNWVATLSLARATTVAAGSRTKAELLTGIETVPDNLAPEEPVSFRDGFFIGCLPFALSIWRSTSPRRRSVAMHCNAE